MYGGERSNSFFRVREKMRERGEIEESQTKKGRDENLNLQIAVAGNQLCHHLCILSHLHSLHCHVVLSGRRCRMGCIVFCHFKNFLKFFLPFVLTLTLVLGLQ